MKSSLAKLKEYLILSNMENGKDPGYIMVPYVFKIVKTTVNNETVWYANKMKNAFLKVKRFFHKSKNYKRCEELSKIKVDSSKFVEMNTITSNNETK